jgi:GDP-L-fucose synthase
MDLRHLPLRAVGIGIGDHRIVWGLRERLATPSEGVLVVEDERELGACNRMLITGADGLLGKRLVEGLRREFPSAELLTPSREELDLVDETAVRAYWEHARPEAVFHLAAFVLGLGGNLAAGATAFTVNARINHNVLLACLEFQPRFTFVAGTVASYKYPYARLPLVEEDAFLDEPHEGEYYYGLAKRAMWPYLQAVGRAGGGATTMALFTNMYGPGDNFNESSGHVVPSLIKRFVEATRAGQNEVMVWGVPDTTRDFLYVDDAVEGLLAALEAKVGVCNISSGRETTMGELVEAITRVTGFEGRVFWDASKPVGIPRRSVDNSRLLGHHPQMTFHNLEEGVRSAVDWYRANY